MDIFWLYVYKTKYSENRPQRFIIRQLSQSIYIIVAGVDINNIGGFELRVAGTLAVVVVR
jgi:hypothetical protein